VLDGFQYAAQEPRRIVLLAGGSLGIHSIAWEKVSFPETLNAEDAMDVEGTMGRAKDKDVLPLINADKHRSEQPKPVFPSAFICADLRLCGFGPGLVSFASSALKPYYRSPCAAPAEA
jgi:hypothetical protein